MPLLTSNTHHHELAALGIALAEMRAFGREYATQVVKNGKALAQALAARGIKVLYGDLGYSESHTVLVEFARACTAVSLLDNAGISVNGCALPWDQGSAVTGLRLGTQVVTRRGMREAEMALIAEATARVLVQGEDPYVVRHELVAPLSRKFDGVAFSFDRSFPLPPDWQEQPYRGTVSTDAAALALRIPAFADLPVSAVRQAARAMTAMTLAPGQRVFARGDTADAVYFVAHGVLDVLGGDDGAVVATVGEGGHVGELGVLLGHPRRNAVRASSAAPAVVLRLGGADLKSLVAAHAPLRAYFDRHTERLTRA
jgi:hypothetical protein